MSHENVGVAVIGYGYWGPNLVRNLANTNSAQLIAVSDLDPAKLAICKRRHPGVMISTEVRDLFKDANIDAIVIATPVHTHYDLALGALKAGKHVLVEKPMVQTSNQAIRLIDEADRRNLHLMVDHTFLYTPTVRKIRDLIQLGILGEIYYYNSTRASLGLFQSDVNVIWDLAIHDISIIQHIINEVPVAVSATAARHVAGTPENMAHLALFFASNFVAHINVNWLAPVKVRQTFIGGSRKMILYNDLEPTEKVKVYDKGIVVNDSVEHSHQLRIGYRAGDMWAPHLAAEEALKIETEHFIECIQRGSRPISDGLSGLQVLRILEASSRSIAAHGTPVELADAGVPAKVIATRLAEATT
jgi:predicted dehydrogenase